MKKQSAFFRKSKGFTLVEVLVVMLILMALSSITLDFTKDFAFQGRYEVTKDRYDKLKRAIIGRPDVLINGQPDISGFVADMGRLPRNIRELLDQHYCLVNRTIDENTSGTAPADCNAITANSWIIQRNYTACSDDAYFNKTDCEANSGMWNSISSGWRGPYLTITKDFLDDNAFMDGWGNLPSDYCTDLTFTTQATCIVRDTWVTDLENHNYGWYFNELSTDNLTILSYGKDQKLGQTTTSEYDLDYPDAQQPTILESDWMVSINNVTVNLITPNNGYCNNETCSNPNFADEVSCTQDNRSWDGTNNLCKVDILTNQSACESQGHTWNSTQLQCQDTNYTDTTTCVSNIRKWEATLNESNCKKGGGRWIANTQDIDLEITYFNGLDSSQISITTATLEENGLYQNIAFNPTAINISQGEITVNIFKTGTSDIYPPSCSGLISADCEDADGVATDAVLLSNNLCDNVTIQECTDAGGKLLRNTQNILIVPHKNIGTINW